MQNQSSTISLWVIAIWMSPISSRPKKRRALDSLLMCISGSSASSSAYTTITMRQMLPSRKAAIRPGLSYTASFRNRSGAMRSPSSS